MKNQIKLNTEKEYRQYPAINYSRLATFNQHPDYCLIEKKPASTAMETGKIFETYLEKLITESKNNTFDAKYKIIEEDFINKYPDILNVADQNLPVALINRVESGYEFTDEDLHITKTGNWNKVKFRENFYIQYLILNPKKYPLMPSAMKNIKIMCDNFLKLEVFGVSVSTILKNAKFQYKHIWNGNGVEKKAMYDAIANINIDGFGEGLVAFDFKTTADLQRFKNMWYSKYWIQDRHYSAGIQDINKNESCFNRMVFLVVMNQAPFTAFPMILNEMALERREESYQELITDYTDWTNKGRNYIGTTELIELN